jgi:hypothetical protein
MVSLSRQLNKLLIGVLLLAVPVEAYIPKEQIYPTYVDPVLVAKFKAGHTAPYNKQYVRRVVVGKAQIMPNGAIISLPFGPDLVPSFEDLQHHPKFQEKKTWSLNEFLFPVEIEEDNFYWNEKERRWIDTFFWTTQLLDIYSTYKGMKYDCLYEANPLLPEVPNIHEMAGLKLTVIGGMRALFDDPGNKDFWYDWKLFAGSSTAVVVANNFRLLERAKRRCNKR